MITPWARLRLILEPLKPFADLMFVPLYFARGRRPWSLGYYTHKKHTICKAIDTNAFQSSSPIRKHYGFGVDERAVEYPWVFSRLPTGQCRMLDAGSSLNHKFLLDRLPLDEIKLTIMTLAPEKQCQWFRSISYVYGDLRQPVFADSLFDVVVSISTIEHIGLNNTLLYTCDSSKDESDASGFVPAVKQFRRILKPGGQCLITVPYGKREIREWYQVFDNAHLGKIIEAFQPTSACVDYFGYYASGWRAATADELKDAVFHDTRKGARHASDNAAAARGVACLILSA